MPVYVPPGTIPLLDAVNRVCAELMGADPKPLRNPADRIARALNGLSAVMSGAESPSRPLWDAEAALQAALANGAITAENVSDTGERRGVAQPFWQSEIAAEALRTGRTHGRGLPFSIVVREAELAAWIARNRQHVTSRRWEVHPPAPAWGRVSGDWVPLDKLPETLHRLLDVPPDWVAFRLRPLLERDIIDVRLVAPPSAPPGPEQTIRALGGWQQVDWTRTCTIHGYAIEVDLYSVTQFFKEEIRETIEGQDPLLEIEAPPTGPATSRPSVIPTGMPGRPTKGRDILLAEFERRAAAGQIEPSLAKQAKVLIQWLRTERPEAEVPTPGTTANTLREAYNRAKAARPNGHPTK